MCGEIYKIGNKMWKLYVKKNKHPYNILTIIMILLGIGLDDLFILLSSWRHTSCSLATEERMALTLKNAAVSITITSATDALAYGVGK